MMLLGCAVLHALLQVGLVVSIIAGVAVMTWHTQTQPKPKGGGLSEVATAAANATKGRHSEHFSRPTASRATTTTTAGLTQQAADGVERYLQCANTAMICYYTVVGYTALLHVQGLSHYNCCCTTAHLKHVYITRCTDYSSMHDSLLSHY
jgi:hypothetical protein